MNFNHLIDNLWTRNDLEQMVLEDIPLPQAIKSEVQQSIMVLLVAVDIDETLATRSNLQPLDGHKSIYKFDQGGQQTRCAVYYVGKYGACPAAIRVIPPSFQVHESTLSISMMANQCFPNLGGIVSMGVACGIKGKVEMCDVLVSSHIVKYENNEYSTKGEAIPVSSQLNRLFTQPIQWPNDTIKKHLNDIGECIPNVKSGVILSGLYSADDPTMKKIPIQEFPHEAIGLEMDGSYLCITNQQDTANTIIVKAVCSFEDGKINTVYQPTAALLAADLVHKCLSDPQAPKLLKG